MKCSRARKLIPSLSNDELDASQHQDVEEHLRRCGACQKIATEFGTIAQLSRAMPLPPEPAGFYDEFLRDTMNRLSKKLAASPRYEKARSLRPPFRPRVAIAGAGIAIAVVLFALFFVDRGSVTRRDQRLTLADYLIHEEYYSLARAMQDDQERQKLLADSVSVDLAIAALKQLQKIDKRHGQVGRYITRWMIKMQDEAHDQPMAFGDPPHYTLQEFDFKAALRTLRKVGRFTGRITLKESVEAWDLQPKSGKDG